MLGLCPIYGCPDNCRESLSMPTATFLAIFNGLLFQLTVGMCVQNLQFVALPEVKTSGIAETGVIYRLYIIFDTRAVV